jgi:hypothetical protein
MRQAEEERTLVVNLENVLAGRIWTEFRNRPDHQVLAKKFEAAINDARRKHPQAPDDAIVPVTVHITVGQARTILKRFKDYLGAPHDNRVYTAVSDALKRSETNR